jgi:hypothetical protein
MGITLPELRTAILHIHHCTTFCSSHMAIMAGTMIYFIAPPLVQTPHQNGNLCASVKPSIIRFAYILVMANTPPSTEADDYFNNTLSTCGPRQIKHV